VAREISQEESISNTRSESNMKTWNDITIEKAEAIFSAAEKHEHPIAKRAAIYAAAMGEDFDKLYNMGLSDFESYTKEWRFLDTSPSKKVPKEWDGYELTGDIKDLSAGQLVDIETTTKDGKNTLHRVMALLWKKDMPLDEKEKYVRENMPYPIARGVHDFFLRRSLRLQSRLVRYLALRMRTQLMKLRLQIALDKFFGGFRGSRKSRKRTTAE